MARLRGASVTSPRLDLSLKPFGAEISFVETDISISGRGLLGKSPIEIRGGVSGLSPARLNLTVSSERMDFGALQSAIPLRRTLPIRWPTPGRFSARITGTGVDPLVTISASAPRVLINGVQADTISAQAVYAHGSIRVTSLSGEVARGRLAMTASIALRPLTVGASGRLTGVDLAALPIPGEPRASGLADVIFAGAYARGSPSGRASVTIRAGSVGGYSFRGGSARVSVSGASTADMAFSVGPGAFEQDVRIDSASGDISIRGRRIIVRRLVVNGAGGAISATGDATEDGDLNFRLAAKHVNLASILVPLGYKDVIGTMDFDGDMSGTIGNPRLVGRIELRNGRIRDIPLDTASVRVTASTTEIVLEDPLIRSGGSEIVGTGHVSIGAERAPSFDMRVRASQLNLAILDSLFGTKLKGKGTAGADLLVRGEYPDLQVSGEVLAENAVISGIVIDRARLVARTVGAETLIEEMVLQQGNARVTGRGSIGPQGRLQINVTGENL
ncbi:MAG: hypothetical protein NTU88_11405, partial [Armatimonadetes bacterium]|nr:hypothetical protein [Armatimonadota bacterium]